MELVKGGEGNTYTASRCGHGCGLPVEDPDDIKHELHSEASPTLCRVALDDGRDVLGVANLDVVEWSTPDAKIEEQVSVDLVLPLRAVVELLHQLLHRLQSLYCQLR